MMIVSNLKCLPFIKIKATTISSNNPPNINNIQMTIHTNKTHKDSMINTISMNSKRSKLTITTKINSMAKIRTSITMIKEWTIQHKIAMTITMKVLPIMKLTKRSRRVKKKSMISSILFTTLPNKSQIMQLTIRIMITHTPRPPRLKIKILMVINNTIKYTQTNLITILNKAKRCKHKSTLHQLRLNFHKIRVLNNLRN